MEINGQEQNMTIEQLERAYLNHSTSVPDHQWGEEQEAELGRLADALRAAYDAAGTDEFDRIAL